MRRCTQGHTRCRSYYRTGWHRPRRASTASRPSSTLPRSSARSHTCRSYRQLCRFLAVSRDDGVVAGRVRTRRPAARLPSCRGGESASRLASGSTTAEPSFGTPQELHHAACRRFAATVSRRAEYPTGEWAGAHGGDLGAPRPVSTSTLDLGSISARSSRLDLGAPRLPPPSPSR